LPPGQCTDRFQPLKAKKFLSGIVHCRAKLKRIFGGIRSIEGEFRLYRQPSGKTLTQAKLCS
jgi:hypothetical protein